MIDELTSTIRDLETKVAALVDELGPASLDDQERAAAIEAEIDQTEQELTKARQALSAVQVQQEQQARAEQRRREAAEAELSGAELKATEADAREARAIWLEHTVAIIEAETKVTELRKARAAAIDQDAQEHRLHVLRAARVEVESHLQEGTRDVAAIKAEVERHRQRAAFIRSGINLAPVVAEREERAVAQAEEVAERKRHHLRGRLVTEKNNLARETANLAAERSVTSRLPDKTAVANLEALVARHTQTVADLETQLADLAPAEAVTA